MELLNACKHGNTELAIHLINNGADVNFFAVDKVSEIELVDTYHQSVNYQYQLRVVS